MSEEGMEACAGALRRSTFHRRQERIQIVFFLVLAIIPELAEVIQPALLALLLDLTVDIDHVDFVARLIARFLGCFCRFAEVEEIQELVGVHGAEAGVLLIDHGGGDVDLESL